MGDSDEEGPRLSSHTLAAPQEFYTEQQEKVSVNTQADHKHCFGSVEEDWQLSQFWYSDETALHLAKEGIAAAGAGGRIACVCAPTVYQKLKDLNCDDCSTCLLEYDKRFSIYGDKFIFYDYNYPLNLPNKLEKNSFDIVIADPPYLSEECLGKTAQTIKFLTKEKILLCTGAVMEDTAAKLLGVEACQYVPKHTRHLAIEFRCYANYDCGLDSNC